jgi:hypothetical protein
VARTKEHRVSKVYDRIRGLDQRLATISRSKQLLNAKGTLVDALVARQAIVVAVMKTALDAKQVTGSTLRPTELYACSEVNNRAVERSPQLFNACVLGLETLCVRLQPFVNVRNA